MSFAMACKQRLGEAGLTCRACFARVAIALMLTLSAASVVADPFVETALVTDMDDAPELALALTPDPFAGAPVIPVATDLVPDFKFDDLRAERLAASHDWRVACLVQARGPPV